MSETLEDYVRRRFDEMYRERLRSLGWWCPRCDLPAFPWEHDSDGPGACRFCGMDPLTEGPPPIRELRGIMGATKKTARR